MATTDAHIPRTQLCLCLDCEACFRLGPERCPACSSSTWIVIARVCCIPVRELAAAAAGGGAREETPS